MDGYIGIRKVTKSDLFDKYVYGRLSCETCRSGKYNVILGPEDPNQFCCMDISSNGNTFSVSICSTFEDMVNSNFG